MTMQWKNPLAGLVAIVVANLGSVAIAADGAELYSRHCAACHEGAVNRAPQKILLRLMSPITIQSSLTSGLMAPQAAHLREEEIWAISTYLSGQQVAENIPDFDNAMCSTQGPDFDFSRLPAATGWGQNLQNHRYIAKPGLEAAEAPRLALKWAFAFPGANRARSQPSFAGGNLFVGSQDGTVYSLDAQSGCIRWRFRAAAEVRNHITISAWDKHDEESRPHAYFGDIIGNVYAIDARDGTLVWRRRVSEHPNATITGSPALAENMLYVPVSSLEIAPAVNPHYECCTFRGSVVALEPATGDTLWETFTIPTSPRVTGVNAVGVDRYGPSGAAVWNTPSIDIKRRQIVVGTGQNYSSPATDTSNSIISMDMDTGAINWVRQTTAGDAWNSACTAQDRTNCPKEDGPDFDFGAATILVNLDGHDLIVAGQKSGYVFGIDPDDGELRWSTRVGRGGIQGGIHFGMAYGDGRIYVPISDKPDGREYDEAARPGLYALRPEDGSFIWEQPHEDRCDGRRFCAPGISSAITAAPGVVFAGAMDGTLRAYDARDGRVIWSVDTAIDYPETVLGIVGRGGSLAGGDGPIAYEGRLYVNSGYGIYSHAAGNVLLMFELAK